MGSQLLTRDRTGTPCVRRQSLKHWTTREVPVTYFFTWALVTQPNSPVGPRSRSGQWLVQPVSASHSPTLIGSKVGTWPGGQWAESIFAWTPWLFWGSLWNKRDVDTALRTTAAFPCWGIAVWDQCWPSREGRTKGTSGKLNDPDPIIVESFYLWDFFKAWAHKSLYCSSLFTLNLLFLAVPSHLSICSESYNSKQ